VKNYLSTLLLGLGIIVACNNSGTNDDITTEIINNPSSADQPVPDPSKLPKLVFDTLEHDFGEIKEGEKVTYEFIFKNNGANNLLITNVAASCGCTTPYYPKNIIKAGEGDKIKIVYDSKGRPGKFNKSITVTANTYPNTTKLHIKGNVIEAK
jgi:hypothetical protein